VTLSMIGLKAAAPLGSVQKPPPSTGRDFAALVLVDPKIAAPTSTPEVASAQ
jgi:hypothetical protein